MVRRRSFLIGSALTAGSLITGWYLGSILPYRKTDEIKEITKTETVTSTKILTKTSTTTVTTTTTSTTTHKPEPISPEISYVDAVGGMGDLAYEMEIIARVKNSSDPLEGRLVYPDMESILPLSFSYNNIIDQYRAVVPTEQVGGHLVLLKASDVKKIVLPPRYPLDMLSNILQSPDILELPRQEDEDLNVGVSQEERLASNPKLLDKIFKKSRFDEDLFRIAYDYVKNRDSLRDNGLSNNSINALLTYASSTLLYPAPSVESVNLVLDEIEKKPELVLGIDTVEKSMNLLHLAERVPNITRHPLDWREGAIQIYDIDNLVNPPNEKEKWSVLGPMIAYGIDKLDRGEAMDLTLPDKKIEAWARRERLLPLDLFKINIITGEYSDQPRFEIGRYNVSHNDNLGTSPQQWLDDMAKKDFREKDLRYELAILRAKNSHPNTFWPNSDKEYLRIFDTVLSEDEEAVFIQGYPRALGSEYIPFKLEPIVPMSGQTDPYYSKFIARAFGRASFVVSADYPERSAHDEAYVVISPEIYSKISSLVPYTFGYWTSGELLKKDHDGKRPPNPRIFRPDWTEEPIII